MAVHRFYLKKLQEEGLTVSDVARMSNCTITQVLDLLCRRKPLGEDRLEKIAKKMNIRDSDIEKMKHINKKVAKKYQERRLPQGRD